jgi:hypothetical protein
MKLGTACVKVMVNYHVAQWAISPTYQHQTVKHHGDRRAFLSGANEERCHCCPLIQQHLFPSISEIDGKKSQNTVPATNTPTSTMATGRGAAGQPMDADRHADHSSATQDAPWSKKNAIISPWVNVG